MRRFARPLYFVLLAAILVLALMPQVDAPVGTPNDKVNHVLAFFTLALLARLLWPRTRLVVPFVWLTLLGGAIEVLQDAMKLGRDGDWIDFAADVGAVLAGIGVAQAVLKARRWRRGLRKLRSPRPH